MEQQKQQSNNSNTQQNKTNQPLENNQQQQPVQLQTKKLNEQIQPSNSQGNKFKIHKNSSGNRLQYGMKQIIPTNQIPSNNSSRPNTGQFFSRNAYNSKIRDSPIFMQGDNQLQRESDFFKHNISAFDKERVFDDLLRAKQQLNEFKDENSQMKTKITNLQKEIQKYEKMLEESNLRLQTQKQTSPDAGIAKATSLLINLKNKVKDLTEQLRLKNQEIIFIKKNIKYTRFQEVNLEKEQFAQETVRLRSLLDEYQQKQPDLKNINKQKAQLEQSFINQDIVCKELKKDNIEMAKTIKILEEQSYNLKEQNNLVNKNYKQLQKDFLAQKKENHEKEIEIKKIKEELNSSLNAAAASKKQITQNSSQTPLQQLGKSETFESLAKSKIEKERNEKLAQDYSNLQKDLQEKNQTIQQLQEQLELLKKKMDIDYKQQKEMNSEKLRRVKEENVQEIGKELRSELMIKQIQYDSMEQMIIPQDLQAKGKATPNEIKCILEKEPFNLKDPKKVDLLIKYLTDDSQQPSTYFDPEAQCGVTIIREKFTHIIGDYDIFKEETIREIIQIIKQKISEKFPSLQRTLEQFSRDKTTINSQQLELALHQCQIQLEERENNQFWIQIYQNSNKDLSKIQIKDISTLYKIEQSDQLSTGRSKATAAQKPQGEKQNAQSQQNQCVGADQNSNLQDSARVQSQSQKKKASSINDLDQQLQQLQMQQQQEEKARVQKQKEEEERKKMEAKLQQELLEEQNKAATKIQKSFKGKKQIAEAKKIAQEKRMEKEQIEAAIKIQKKFKSQKQIDEAKQIAKEKKILKEQNEAATKIQKSFKGKKQIQEAKKIAQEKKKEKELQKEKQIKKAKEEAEKEAEKQKEQVENEKQVETKNQQEKQTLQAEEETKQLKKYEIENDQSNLEQENQAASKIQKSFRGKKQIQEAKKIAQEKKQEKLKKIEQEQNEAAIQIQKNFKGKKQIQEAKKIAEEKKQEKLKSQKKQNSSSSNQLENTEQNKKVDQDKSAREQNQKQHSNQEKGFVSQQQNVDVIPESNQENDQLQEFNQYGEDFEGQELNENEQPVQKVEDEVEQNQNNHKQQYDSNKIEEEQYNDDFDQLHEKKSEEKQQKKMDDKNNLENCQEEIEL